MIVITDADFISMLGQLENYEQHETLAVTSGGRVIGYFVPVGACDRAARQMRRVYSIGEMPDDLFRSIVDSTMHARHNHLNSLLGEED